jgi:excisionase family DNA binding protein
MMTDRRSTDLLTLPEAAASLGVSPSTLRNQVRTGRMTAEKFGRDRLVTWGEVERYRRESLGRHQGEARRP